MPDEQDSTDRVSPLTDVDLDDINRALARLDDAARLMEKSQQAGIDVEPFKEKAREAKDRLLGIKRAFFPGR